MLKFCSLYSGSSGNCSFVQTEHTKLLIDTGVSMKKIIQGLNSINISINDINAILITHEHSDHICSLGNISKKFNIPVFANEPTWNAMPSQACKVLPENKNFFRINEDFCIGDVNISPFNIPHDAASPCGFNIFNGNHKISIATDIGHITTEILNSLKNSSFILLESNYEPQVLQACSYPYELKSRISGPNGHLSNVLAGQTISQLIDSGLHEVMLGHLSKESNFPELALNTVIGELISNNCDVNSIDITVANRFEPSKVIDVS